MPMPAAPLRFVLAPLAGFTDAPFRRLCFEGGADLCYTEMVSAAGLAHGSSPTRHLMETMPGEGPVACQVFGATESDLALAAREVEGVKERFVEINLNAGCPMKKVTCSGAGAKLVEDPEKVYRLLVAMRENTSLPVTLKTRLGPHPAQTNAFELLDAAERAGASGVTFHARYTSQMHGGAVHLDTLAELVRRAHVPVTGNGSVVDAKTAAAMAATGVSAIMVGRAALPNPAIFAELKGAFSGGQLDSEAVGHRFHISSDALGTYSTPGTYSTSGTCSTFDTHSTSGTHSTLGTYSTFENHLSYLLSFRDQLATRFPNDHVPSADGFASVKMHVHLFRYFNGRPGAAALRARLNAVRTLAEIREIVSSG
jgi:tRNA-dihydrouridine synthase B